MLDIKKTYIVDEKNNRVAVQIDVETFNRIEDALENYALVNLMKDEDDSDTLSVAEAKAYYDKLDKAD